MGSESAGFDVGRGGWGVGTRLAKSGAMNITTALRSVLVPFLGSLALVSAVGCSGVVSQGSSGDGGAGGDGGSGGNSTMGSGGAGGGQTSPPNPTGGAGGVGGETGCNPAECGIADGVAMTYAQLDAASQGTGGSGQSATTGVGGGPDPSTQFLIYGAGTETPTCSAPYGSGGCGGWRVSISLPASLLQPGVVAFGSGADFSFSVSFDEGNGTCSGGGGGGFEEGQIEILSVTATSVHFVVSGTDTFDFNANGEHLVDRCP